MKDTDIIGKYSVQDLKRVKYYLTYQGAQFSQACNSALGDWERYYNCCKLEAAELTKNFIDYCPYYWAAMILGGKGKYGIMSEITCCPFYHLSNQCEDCNGYNKSLKRHYWKMTVYLRAAIIKLCEENNEK